MSFEEDYEKVKPIVLKLRKQYVIKLWDYDDWLQEGRLVFFELVSSCPYLLADHQKLYPYFKTKFSNYLKDVIRYQESFKRRFNQLPYAEISEVSHCIGESVVMETADYLAYQEAVKQVENLGEEMKEKLAKVMRGERFAGKKAFLRQVETYFAEFKDDVN